MLNHNIGGMLSSSNSVILILKKLFPTIASVFYKVISLGSQVKQQSSTPSLLTKKQTNHKNLYNAILP